MSESRSKFDELFADYCYWKTHNDGTIVMNTELWMAEKILVQYVHELEAKTLVDKASESGTMNSTTMTKDQE